MTIGGEDSGQPAWREHILGPVGLPSSMADGCTQGFSFHELSRVLGWTSYDVAAFKSLPLSVTPVITHWLSGSPVCQ